MWINQNVVIDKYSHICGLRLFVKSYLKCGDLAEPGSGEMIQDVSEPVYDVYVLTQQLWL